MFERPTLRWNAQRTLGLLGSDGDALVAEFVDVHPASEDFAEEAASFCDFVVRRTAELAGTQPLARHLVGVVGDGRGAGRRADLSRLASRGVGLVVGEDRPVLDP